MTQHQGLNQTGARGPEPHTAACLAVGSELLGDVKTDRNSLEITATLAHYGFRVCEKRIVGDDADMIAAGLRELAARYEVVVVTGGLGPTADDVTREGVAAAFDRQLGPDPVVERRLAEWFRKLGRSMPDICRSMARVVEGSKVLVNDRGAAPGLMVETNGCLVAVFPGVPWEMRGMLARDLVPELERRSGGVGLSRRTLLLGGVVESQIEQKISPLYERFGRENVTILASFGVLRLVLSASGPRAESGAVLERMEGAFRKTLQDDVVGVDIDSIAEAVVPELARCGVTLATAESCTGGMVGAEVTSVSGSSDAYLGGVVSYSNEAKTTFVDVPEHLLIAHGAVSAEVAEAMAAGVRRRFGADVGLAVTGIAGPTGGTDEKPVGLVYWAVADAEGAVCDHRVFRGSRDIVRRWSTNMVLDLLRRHVISGAS